MAVDVTIYKTNEYETGTSANKFACTSNVRLHTAMSSITLTPLPYFPATSIIFIVLSLLTVL